MFWNSMMNSSSFYFSPSFEVLDEKDDYSCEKKYSYDGNEGDHVPYQNHGLLFECSDDRCLASERIRRIRYI